MAEQLTVQPFFDALGQACAPHAPGVNTAATARLERVLKSPADAPGRGILLRAPRAGFGKTHLLSFVQQRLGTTHEFLPLNPVDGSRIDAAGAIEAALRRLTRPLPAGGGLTGLDLMARRLFSMALQPLVSSGEVPCQDREAALGALRQRPVETFDFHHSQAVTAHWTKENFEVLGPRLALELSRRTGTSLNESSFWLASLFRFAVATPEHPGRTGMIIQSATSEAGPDRYAALLAMLSLIGRVVVVADDLEGMHADPAAALKFASFVATVRQEAPRVDVVVSLNDDIWQSAFVPALSGGLQDRLGEIEIRLEPLDQEAMVSLLDTRTPGRTASLRTKLTLSPGEFYARRVLRKVAELDDEDEVPVPARIAGPAPAPVEIFKPDPVEPPPAAEKKEEELPVVAIEEPVPEPPMPGIEVETEPVEEFRPPLSTTAGEPVEMLEEAAVAPGGDRIDDLLRQFRERYGRE